MAKKNKRKTNLKASLLLLLLTAVLLIVSTYAWFTANQTVTVESLAVSVETKGGLQISTDATNWKTVLLNEDLLASSLSTFYPDVNNQIPKVLQPVSTAGGIDTSTGYMDMYLGDIKTNDDGEYIIESTKTTETYGTTGNFIVFDMFLKADKNMKIGLTPKSKVTSATDKGLKQATRIAFLNEGTKNVDDTIESMQALKGATSADIWEPNYDIHTAFAVGAAKSTYNITTTQTNGSLLAYDGIKAPFAGTENVLMASLKKTLDGDGKVTSVAYSTHHEIYPDYFATVTPTYKTAASFSAEGSTTNLKLYDLTAGVTKIRVYMWIEGQDVDCENNASGTDAIFDLQITNLDAADNNTSASTETPAPEEEPGA